jgi:hypothetical protein
MKNVPCIMAGIAAIATIVAVVCKLTGAAPFNVVPRGALVFAGVMLLFGINHSLCKRCIQE